MTMTSKKRLLFVIDSLGVGGAEKSLVTLLGVLDYSRFEVDLQQFATGGAFSSFVPPQVNVLPAPEITAVLSQPLWRTILKPRLFFARLAYSLEIRLRGLSVAGRASLYWKRFGRRFGRTSGRYDVAIAYAQGMPTFYVADCVNAGRRLAWVNVDYRIDGRIRDFQRGYYSRMDTIVPVSESVLEVFGTEVYPEFRHKMRVVRDMIDGRVVERMSLLPPDKPIDRTLPVIMTAGRLNKPQKGYDLALAAAKIMREHGTAFRWYAVGEGPYRGEMERYIADNGLQEHFVLLGATPNPYSYMRQCDIYVQTSRHEGFGLTIAEARILNRPVVCTDFDGCRMQIADGRNGLITPLEPEAVAAAVERLLCDRELRNGIVEYLRREPKGNTGEIEKFYTLLE